MATSEKQYGMVIDQNLCIGCWTCAVGCKEINNEPLGLLVEPDPHGGSGGHDRRELVGGRRPGERQHRRPARHFPGRRDGVSAGRLPALRGRPVRQGVPGRSDVPPRRRHRSRRLRALHRLPLLHRGVPLRDPRLQLGRRPARARTSPSATGATTAPTAGSCSHPTGRAAWSRSARSASSGSTWARSRSASPCVLSVRASSATSTIPNSEVSELVEEQGATQMLSDLGTRPRVFYIPVNEPRKTRE